MGLSRATLVPTYPTVAGSSFLPTDISGLWVWLDFSDATQLFQDNALTTPVTADGDPIGGVTDKSSNGYDCLQNTAANKPTYKTGIQNGLSTGRWDGSNDRLRNTSIAAMTAPYWTFVVVMNTTAGTGGQITGDGGSRGTLVHDNGTTSRAKVNAGADVVGATDLAAGTFYLVSTYVNGASSVVRLNGVQDASGDAGSTDFGTALNVGTNQIGGGVLLGDIGELVMYDADLTSTERDQVESYLMTKWGL